MSAPDEPARRIAIDWGPTLDAGACTACGTCIDFCRNDVYAWRSGRVVVAHKDGCVPGCSHCATLCDAGALSFPTFADIKRARRGE